MYTGSTDAGGNTDSRVHNPLFRPANQIDANGNPTWLTWSTDGKYLQQVADANGNTTTFNYDTVNERLNYSLDAQGRKSDYTYGDLLNPRLPTIIKIIDTVNGNAVLRWQQFSYDSKGRTLTEELRDTTGATALQQTTRTYGTSGNSFGLLESVTVHDLINAANNSSTTYTYDSAGRVVKIQQSSLLGTCQFSYMVYDAAGDTVATVCGHQSVTAPTTVAQAIAMYDANDPVKKDNRVTTYEYDTLGRRVKTTTNAGATLAQTTLTVYDALNRIVRTISNYVANGAILNPYTAAQNTFTHGTDNNQNLVSDTAYNIRGMVRKQVDVLGNVTLYGYDTAGRLVKTVQSAHLPNYNNDYTTVIDPTPDPTLNAYAPNSTADQDIVTSNQYDAAGNLVKTIDLLGNVTFTAYNPLNQPVKVVRNAKDTATISLNVGAVGYDGTLDPRSDLYVPSTDPARDSHRNHRLRLHWDG